MSDRANRIELIAKIGNSSNIVIAGHEFPDGDSIGSCLALALALNKMGKKVWVMLGDRGDKYDIIPGQQFIYEGDISLLEPDLFICVDCASEERLGEASDLFRKSSQTICIDHHETGGDDPFADISYISTKASATCELIFHVLNEMGLINKDVASAIYAGIVYDTGGFLHKSTTPECLNVTAELLKQNIPFSDIYNSILKERSLRSAKMLALALSRLKLDDGIAYSYVTYDDLVKEGADMPDLDQISNELSLTTGATVSIFVYEKKSGISKASFRSKNIDVREIAKSFGGGGHKGAAGSDISAPAQEALPLAINKVCEALK